MYHNFLIHSSSDGHLGCFHVLGNQNWKRHMYPNVHRSSVYNSQESRFYTITSNNQLSGWTKKKIQSSSLSQTCTQQRSWSLFGGLLFSWSTTAFWILVRPLHLRSMFSKWMRYTENYNACSQRWSTERAQFSSSWQCPTIGHTIDASKVEQTWLQSFASYAIFTWPLANRLPLLQASRQLVAGKMLPQLAGFSK